MDLLFWCDITSQNVSTGTTQMPHSIHWLLSACLEVAWSPAEGFYKSDYFENLISSKCSLLMIINYQVPCFIEKLSKFMDDIESKCWLQFMFTVVCYCSQTAVSSFHASKTARTQISLTATLTTSTISSQLLAIFPVREFSTFNCIVIVKYLFPMRCLESFALWSFSGLTK